MNNAEMKEVFNEVIENMPQDMRLSKHESSIMVEKFMNEISVPLQNMIASMLKKATEKGELSAADRQQLTRELMTLVLPYIQSFANGESLN